MGNKANRKRHSKMFFRNKQKEMMELVRSRKALLKQSGTSADQSSSIDISKVTEEDLTEKNNQELCMQIKNSLKRLRRQSGGDDTDITDSVSEPTLTLEVFPDEIRQPNDTNQNSDKDEEPSTEFHDESLIEENEASAELHHSLLKELPSKPKKPKPLPVKRRKLPKRRAVIEQEIKQSIIAARKAPAVEKVFINSVKKVDDNETKAMKGKKACSNTSEISNFDHTEQLYEFGKYVAEQMICFDENDVRSAQEEIKEVLKKFRLKYKIMNTLSRPSQPTNGDSTVTERSVNTAPARPEQVNITIQKTQSQVKYGRSVTQMTSQVNLARPSVTQVNTAGPSVTQTRLPQVMSVVPSMNELTLNKNSSSPMTPLGFIIMPTQSSPGFHITTQRVDSTGAVVSQPGSSFLISAEKLVTGLGSPYVMSTETLVNQPVQRSSVESIAPQPKYSQVNIVESPSTQPGFSNTITAQATETQPVTQSVFPEIPVTQGVNSETSGPQSETLRPRNIIDVIPITVEPESLIIKYEAESESEDET